MDEGNFSGTHYLPSKAFLLAMNRHVNSRSVQHYEPVKALLINTSAASGSGICNQLLEDIEVLPSNSWLDLLAQVDTSVVRPRGET